VTASLFKLNDVSADLPIGFNEFGVYSLHRAKLAGAIGAGDLFEQLAVALADG
jgi:hypothetical protein